MYERKLYIVDFRTFKVTDFTKAPRTGFRYFHVGDIIALNLNFSHILKFQFQQFRAKLDEPNIRYDFLLQNIMILDKKTDGSHQIFREQIVTVHLHALFYKDQIFPVLIKKSVLAD